MSQLIKNGPLFEFAPNSESMHGKLPAGLYKIIRTVTGYYFQQEEPFQQLREVYGDHPRLASRILRSFEERSGNTGVLLAGSKGSGKSFLARLISQEAMKSDIPTILITDAFSGEDLRGLFSHFDHPVIILIDEFEKIYKHPDDQTSFLSMLDGLSRSKHMFLFTVNDTEKVSNFMRNRPGRLYYLLEFHGLDELFIREYCQAKLKDQEQLEQLVEMSSHFDEFSFDMLSSLVEEMNRFDETPMQALKYLNIAPTDNPRNGRHYRLTEHSEGHESVTSNWYGDILNPGDEIIYLGREDSEDIALALAEGEMISRDRSTGLYVLKFPRGIVLEFQDLYSLARDKSRLHWTERII